MINTIQKVIRTQIKKLKRLIICTNITISIMLNSHLPTVIQTDKKCKTVGIDELNMF